MVLFSDFGESIPMIMRYLRSASTMGPNIPFSAAPSGLPFTRFYTHTSNQIFSSKLDVSVQMRTVGLDARIPYSGTFNMYTKNPFFGFSVSSVDIFI